MSNVLDKNSSHIVIIYQTTLHTTLARKMPLLRVNKLLIIIIITIMYIWPITK